MYRLQFDREMVEFLNFASGGSLIAQIFLNGESTYIIDEGNYVKRFSDDMVSFLPKSKYEKESNIWESSRVSVKIGRFIRKFINEISLDKFNISDREIEDFVNMYKSYFSRDVSKLLIVSGDDIMKYYLDENYHVTRNGRCGTLWNSCMRQSERNIFMKLYAINDVKMLVFMSDDNKVRARALLWDCVYDNKGNIHKVMDRIYYTYDHDINFFKDWAVENGYIFRFEQNSKSELYFDKGNGSAVALELHVKLPNCNIKYYPYLDTFKYFNIHRKTFSNNINSNYDYTLVQSDGSLYKQVQQEQDELVPSDDDWFDDDDI